MTVDACNNQVCGSNMCSVDSNFCVLYHCFLILIEAADKAVEVYILYRYFKDVYVYNPYDIGFLPLRFLLVGRISHQCDTKNNLCKESLAQVLQQLL